MLLIYIQHSKMQHQSAMPTPRLVHAALESPSLDGASIYPSLTTVPSVSTAPEILSRQLLLAAHQLLSRESGTDSKIENVPTIQDLYVSTNPSGTDRCPHVKPGSTIHIFWTINEPLTSDYKVTLDLGSAATVDVTPYGPGTLSYPPANSNLTPLIVVKNLTVRVTLSHGQKVLQELTADIKIINPTVTLFRTSDGAYILDRGVTVNLNWVADAQYCCLYGPEPGLSLIKHPVIVNRYNYKPRETSILSLVPFQSKDVHGSPSLLHFIVRNPQILNSEIKSGNSKHTFDIATPLVISVVGSDIYKYDLSYEILDSKGVLSPLKPIASGLTGIKDYQWEIPGAKWAVLDNVGQGPSYPLRVTIQVVAYSDAYGTSGQATPQMVKHVMTPRFIEVGYVKIIYLRAADPPTTPDAKIRLEFLAYGINTTYKIESGDMKLTGVVNYPWTPQIIETPVDINNSNVLYKMSIKSSKGYKDSTTYIYT